MSKFRKVAVATIIAVTTTLTPVVAHADQNDYGAPYMIFSCKTARYPWCRP